MSKKNLIAIIAMVVSLIAASLTLVFTVGLRVSADEEDEEDEVVTIGVLDSAEYFNITEREYDDELGYAPVVLSGLSLLGDEYSKQYDVLHVIVPDGVTEVSGFFGYYAGRSEYYTGYGAFSYFNQDEKGPYYDNKATRKVSEVVLPNSLKIIGGMAFRDSLISSITIPASVTSIPSNYNYTCGNYDAFTGCYDLIEIVVQNQNLYEDERMQSCYGEIMRYEAPKYTVTFNTSGGNTISNQIVTKDETATKPADPTKNGYVFLGWFINNEEFNFTTPVTADITLTARWQAASTESGTPVESESKVNVAAIAGGTAGGVVGLGTIGTIIGVVVRKKRRLK